MKVFVAGGSGTIGVPLVRALVKAGHDVVASTRTPQKAPMLRGLGAAPVVVDAFDAAALDAVLREVAPTHVIHELTALPKGGVRRSSDLVPTNRLREEGTRNLLRAAIAAGSRRIIAGSFAILGSESAGRSDGADDPATRAVKSMEAQIVGAAHRGAIEGLVLRYGLFYGLGTSSTDELIALIRKRRLPRVRHDRGQLPYIHIDDAVSATQAALDHGSSGGTYDIVDDRPVSFSEFVSELATATDSPPPFTVPAWLLRLVSPYLARLFERRLTLSNQKARRELGWTPTYPSYSEGLGQAIGAAAAWRNFTCHRQQ